MVVDQLGVLGLAIGREAHDLVLARVDLEPRVIGKGGIQQSQRMGEVNLLDDFEPVTAANGQRGRGPLPHTVHGQHRRFFKRRWEKGARRMAQVVFGEKQFLVPVEVRRLFLEFLLQQILQEQFFAQPDRDRHAERRETARRKGQIGFKQAFELEERLVVEGYVIHLAQPDTGLLQAIRDGMVRIAGIVLLAGEPLFLGSGHDRAVLDQGGGAVVVERGNTQDTHGAGFSPRTACR